VIKRNNSKRLNRLVKEPRLLSAVKRNTIRQKLDRAKRRIRNKIMVLTLTLKLRRHWKRLEQTKNRLEKITRLQKKLRTKKEDLLRLRLKRLKNR
jgi:hypothetical protein